MPVLAQRLSESFVAVAPDKADEIREVFAQMAVKFVDRKGELIDQIAILYAEKLTLEDLTAIIGFYKSPAGARLIAVQPEIARQSMALGHRWGAQIGREIEAEARRELKKRGIEKRCNDWRSASNGQPPVQGQTISETRAKQIARHHGRTDDVGGLDPAVGVGSRNGQIGADNGADRDQRQDHMEDAGLLRPRCNAQQDRPQGAADIGARQVLVIGHGLVGQLLDHRFLLFPMVPPMSLGWAGQMYTSPEP